MDTLTWVQEWYTQQCGNAWGHKRAISISTSTESPGWAVEIPLEGTGLEGKPPETVQMGGDESDWIYCSVEDGVFHGYGSPANLHRVLETFRRWATDPAKS